MKLLIAALLAVFSTNVMAEWTRVGDSDSDSDTNTNTAYVDLSTIRKSGDKVKMWDLLDYKVVQMVNGTRYLSAVAQMEYDCKEETAKLLTFNEHSKNMGQGEVVYSSGNTHAEFEPISPNSLLKTHFKLVCGK